MSGQGNTDHAGALVAALIARLKADAGVRAVLGVAPRVWDRAPAEAGEPFLTLGPVESRPVRGLGCGVEHRLTLTCSSTFHGVEEARAAIAAARACLDDTRPEIEGLRGISLMLCGRAGFARARYVLLPNPYSLIQYEHGRHKSWRRNAARTFC